MFLAIKYDYTYISVVEHFHGMCGESLLRFVHSFRVQGSSLENEQQKFLSLQ
jgi:hypothetical protein